MNRNWSATKQRLHPQSVAEISRHSVLSGDRIWQCGTSSGSHHKDTDQCLSRHFFLQAPQCPCSVRKRFSRDHCCQGRSKPGCRIVGSQTRWELTTWANFQLCLHWLLMLTGFKSSHSGFLDVSRGNGWLRISCWIGQLTCLTIFSTSLSVVAFLRRAGGSMLESTGSHGRGVERRVPEMRRMVEFNCTLTWLVWQSMTRLGCSTLLLNSKVPQQMTAECWRWRPRWNRLASSASCFGSSAFLQSLSSVLCRIAYGLESPQDRLGGTHAEGAGHPDKLTVRG